MSLGRRPATHAILVYHPDQAPEYAARIRKPANVRLEIAADEAAARKVIADVDVVYAWKLPTNLYGSAGRLRWIQAMGAGRKAARGMKAWLGLNDTESIYEEAEAAGLFGLPARERNYVRLHTS